MNKKFIIILLAATMLFGCTKYDEDFEAPKVSFTITPENPKPGDKVTITINSNAEYLSIYTGDTTKNFDYSRICAELKYGSQAFYDSTFRPKISKGNCVWKREMKDYASIDEVLKDFEFFGSVTDIEIGEFEKPSWSKTENSSKRQLRFKINDRNVISGFKFKPNIHLYNWDMFYEMRLVACKEDSIARFVESKNNTVHALYNVTIKKLSNNETINSSGDIWNNSGPWCWDYYFYVYKTAEPMLPPTSDGSKHEFYSLRDRVKYYGNRQDQSYYEEPENHIATEMKIAFGWPREPWENGVTLDKSNIPISRNRYAGFQGWVYLTSIQWGQEVYAPYDQGVSLGSIYANGLQKTYTYTYSNEGQFDIVVVGTNIGRKQYSGNGYKDERGSYDDEYLKKRTIARKTINVKN